jgi:hypothetical protein
MLWTIIIILLILWLLGFIQLGIGAGLLQTLLVIAIILIILAVLGII